MSTWTTPPLIPESAEPIWFRTIWISDTHLGTVGCQSGRLLDFLRCTESAYLYLVRDIIDGWQLRRRWYWHQAHNDVAQKILRKARKGTHVVYIPGNHDEAVRHFIDVAFGGIVIQKEVIHCTARGKRLLNCATFELTARYLHRAAKDFTGRS
jgi:UDP-2,3-diacylglucosamine pyrophosphatase LpxH